MEIIRCLKRFMFAAQTTKARDLRSFVNRMVRKLLAYNFSLRAAPS
jgi:hypothetical protein